MTNPFLPIELLNFTVAVLNQITDRNLELVNISLTQNIFVIISFFCYEPLIQRSLRLHRYFKYFLNFQKRMLVSSTPETANLRLLGFSIISKLTYKNESNQKYFFQKNGHKMLQSFIKDDNEIDPRFEFEALVALANCCDLEDFKLLLWAYGFVDTLVLRFSLSIQQISALIRGNVSSINNSDFSEIQPYACQIDDLFERSVIWAVLIERVLADCHETSISASEKNLLSLILMGFLELAVGYFVRFAVHFEGAKIRLVALGFQMMCNLQKFDLVKREEGERFGKLRRECVPKLVEMVSQSKADGSDYLYHVLLRCASNSVWDSDILNRNLVIVSFEI